MADKCVMYYSYTGNTRKLAGELAAVLEAAVYEVKEVKRPSRLKAYTAGCFAALRMKPGKVQPIAVNLAACGQIVLAVPIWAGHPAPPFHNMLAALPAGKRVEVWAVSGGGSSKAEDKVRAEVEANGCALTRYVDVGPQFSLEQIDLNS